MGDYKRAVLELLHQRIQISNKTYVEPPELPRKLRRNVQWKDPNVNNDHNIKQLIQFDRNNQAKCHTLATINSRLTKSQFFPRRSYSNECLDE